MTAKILLKPPSQVPGQGMTELMKDVVRMAVSDTYTINTDTTPVSLFTVQPYTVVLNAFVEWTTAVDGTLTSDNGLTIGDSDDADALLTRYEPSTLTIDGVMVSGALIKEYTAAQDILLTPAFTSDVNAGACKVWLLYKTDSNVQEVGY